MAAAQRWLIAAGAVAFVVGWETGRTWLFVAGGGAVVLVAGNAAALAVLTGSGPALAGALAVWLADLAISAGRLVLPTRRDQHV